MLDLLLKNCTVVTMDEDRRVLQGASVGVLDGKIRHIGPEPEEEALQVIDGMGGILMPGIVNAHTHLPMVLMRGLADDSDLHTWLNNYIFPAEDRLDERCVYWATQLALCEAIASGTTSVSDMYYFCDAIARAVDEAGVKANLARGLTVFQPGFSFESYPAAREMAELADRWHRHDNGRILVEGCIHAEYTSYETVWREVAQWTRERGLGLQLHLSETRKEHEECVARHGKTPTRVFADCGVFDVPVTAAHGVWVTPEDMDILAEKGASVVHNPVSNLKLASGIAPVLEMRARSINVALGTDGCSSNNTQDMFEEMKTAVITQKTAQMDATAMTARDALEMATLAGARAQGRARDTGRIAQGYDADMVLLDADRPHLMPCHSAESNLVYAARGGDVVLTMVRGRILYRNGAFLTLDIERIRHEVRGYAMQKVFHGNNE